LDHCQHVREVVSHFRIRKAKHPIPCGDELRFTFGVVFSLSGMHLAVELDGEAAFDAAEVEDERPDGMLAAELQPIQTTPAERRPKHILSCRLAGAQVTSGGYVVAMTSPWHGTSVAQPYGFLVPVAGGEDGVAGWEPPLPARRAGYPPGGWRLGVRASVARLATTSGVQLGDYVAKAKTVVEV